MQSIITAFDSAMDSLKAVFSAFIRPMAVFFDIFSDFWLGMALVAVVFMILLVFSVWRDGIEFAKVIRNPRTVAICAMMIAINAVLGFYTPVISNYLKIEFGFVTLPVVSMLFGPITGCLMGMVQDIVCLVVKPTGGLLIALTLTDGITGIIYAAAFYKKKITFVRVLLAQLVVVVIVNITLNSIALAPVAAGGLVAILPSRVIKNFIMLPVQAVIMYAILKMAQKKAIGNTHPKEV